MTDQQPVHSLPLKDEELRAIGMVAQEWAVFEGLINRIISVFLGTEHQKGTLVGVAMSSRLSIEFLSALAELVFHKSEDTKAFQKLLEKATKLQSYRNDVVHLVWVRSEKEPEKLTPIGLKARNTIKFAHGDFSYRSFESLTKDIRGLGGEIALFLDKHGLALGLEDD